MPGFRPDKFEAHVLTRVMEKNQAANTIACILNEILREPSGLTLGPEMVQSSVK